MMSPSSIHIVRRYGLVGGMENYVFHLVNALINKAQKVTVLCEQRFDHTYHPDIQVVVLGNRFSKPRWLAQWGFSQRVSKYIKENAGCHQNVVIHSHERTQVHHVSTFHGPPFLARKKRLLDCLSPRIHMWTALEKQELLGKQVQAILPNSILIGEQLATFYPSIKDKIASPAYPGVEASFTDVARQSSRRVIGFLGKEWQRKGLKIACDVVLRLREQQPDIHFMVAGCNVSEIKHLFQGWPKESYTLLGWVEHSISFLTQIDVLLHPARVEPFGMVVAEANAAGIPVVVSNTSGVASLIDIDQGSVCAIDASIDDWYKACWEQLAREQPVKPLGLSWDDLADQHIVLYNSLSL